MSLGGNTFDLGRIRQTARRLEMAMDAFRASDPSDFISAMREYHDVVVYMNERLFEAHGRLVQGHRDDALRSIEAEPNVLDCLRELDAVDAKLDAWADTFDILEIPRPLRLLIELAEDLGREYDVQHQLATEMRTHRLLALAGGSLESRVSTLRRLIRLDPDNKFWVQDLTEYEKHCQSGMKRELATLDRGLANGVTPAVAARVDQLCTRLSDAEWQEPVDAAIVRQAQAVRTKVRCQHVRAELKNIWELLAAAYSDDDTRRVESLISQWTRLADEISLADDDPLAINSREARVWANEVLDRAAAGTAMVAEVSRLSTVCSRPTPWLPWAAVRYRDQIQDARMTVYEVANRADRGSEVAEWLTAGERRMKEASGVIRNFWLAAGVTASALVVLVAFGVFSSARASSRDDIATELIAEVDRLRSANRAADIAELLDDKKDAYPWLNARDDFRRLRMDFEKEQQAALEAHDSLDKAITKAQGAIAAVDTSLEKLRTFTAIDSGLLAARDGVKSSIATLNNNLADAERLLADASRGRFHDGEAEKDRITEIKDAAAKHDDLFRRCIAAIRSAEIDRVKWEIQQLRERVDGSETIADAVAKIDRMITDIERLAEKGRRETGLRGELAVVREASARGATMTSVRRDLNRGSERGPVDLLRALAAARNQLPSDLRASASAVAESQPCVEAAIAWSAVERTWPADLMGPRTKIAPWQKELLRANALPHPYSDTDSFVGQFESLVEFLDQTAVSIDSLLEDLQPLDELLGSLIMQSDVVEISIGTGTYYARIADVARQPGHFKDEQIYDTRGIGLNDKIRQAVANNNVRPAKHIRLAESLRNTLAQIKRESMSVERGVLAMIAEVFRPQGGEVPDALLRAKLLTMLIDLARARAFFNDNAPLERLADDLGTKVGDVSWVLSQDPVNEMPINASERSEAERIIGRGDAWLRSLDERVGRKVKMLGQRPAFCRTVEYLGWADESGRNGMVLAGTPSTVRLADYTGDIYALIARSDGEASWALVPCGRMNNGKATLRSGDNCTFGQPLFWVDSSSGKPGK
jgi:hypothetical protein